MNDANDFDAVLDWAVENQMSRKPLHPKHPGLGEKRVAVGNRPPDAWPPSDEPTGLFCSTVEAPRYIHPRAASDVLRLLFQVALRRRTEENPPPAHLARFFRRSAPSAWRLAAQ
jgi:hypothetical protein